MGTRNSLHDMLDFTDVPRELCEVVSDYKINVIDIGKFENTDVCSRNLAKGLLFAIIKTVG